MKRARIAQGTRIFDRPPKQGGQHQVRATMSADAEVDLVGIIDGNAVFALDSGELGFVPVQQVSAPAPQGPRGVASTVAAHFRSHGQHAVADKIAPPAGTVVPAVDANGATVSAPSSRPTPLHSNPVMQTVLEHMKRHGG